MSEPGELEREAVETIERVSEESAGVQLDLKLGPDRAQLLRVSATGKTVPWYRETRSIVAVLAFLVSATSLLYSWRTRRAEEVHQKRQELRQIVQQLTEMRIQFIADLARITDEQQRSDIGSVLYAKQTILLEAAEALAGDIPHEVTTSAYRTLAWENVHAERLAQAERFFQAALDASGSPTGRAYAYRDLGVYWADYRGEVEKARAMFQQGLQQLEHEWDPAADIARADTYGTWGALESDRGDAAKAQDYFRIANDDRARVQAVRDARRAAGGAPPAAGPLPPTPLDLQSASVFP